MLHHGLHVSDQDLLQMLDGELPRRRSAAVQAHCENCWSCRARMTAIESTITDFTMAHRQSLDPQLPPVAGPRALLKARLAEQAHKTNAFARWRIPGRALLATVAAICCLLFAGAVIEGTALWRARTEATRSGAISLEAGTVPDRNLTPGAFRPVSVSEVCSMPHEEVVRRVPDSLRDQVLAEYGIKKSDAHEYEIDYLITPGLGGTDDIHNLWPEPLQGHEWNALVKDALEERLHDLVCTHQIGLETAQRDIATDWIAAYMQYFHSDKPRFHLSISG